MVGPQSSNVAPVSGMSDVSDPSASQNVTPDPPPPRGMIWPRVEAWSARCGWCGTLGIMLTSIVAAVLMWGERRLEAALAGLVVCGATLCCLELLFSAVAARAGKRELLVDGVVVDPVHGQDEVLSATMQEANERVLPAAVWQTADALKRCEPGVRNSLFGARCKHVFTFEQQVIRHLEAQKKKQWRNELHDSNAYQILGSSVHGEDGDGCVEASPSSNAGTVHTVERATTHASAEDAPRAALAQDARCEARSCCVLGGLSLL